MPDYVAVSSNSRVINRTFVAGKFSNTQNIFYLILWIVGEYSVPQICIVFRRRAGFCFLQLFVPSTAAVAATWISLWLESETQFADIVAIILAIIFLSYHYNTVMPKVSYVKVIVDKCEHTTSG